MPIFGPILAQLSNCAKLPKQNIYMCHNWADVPILIEFTPYIDYWSKSVFLHEK